MPGGDYSEVLQSHLSIKILGINRYQFEFQPISELSVNFAELKSKPLSLENATIAGHFGFMFEENSCREIRSVLIFSALN